MGLAPRPQMCKLMVGSLTDFVPTNVPTWKEYNFSTYEVYEEPSLGPVQMWSMPGIIPLGGTLNPEKTGGMKCRSPSHGLLVLDQASCLKDFLN